MSDKCVSFRNLWNHNLYQVYQEFYLQMVKLAFLVIHDKQEKKLLNMSLYINDDHISIDIAFFSSFQAVSDYILAYKH